MFTHTWPNKEGESACCGRHISQLPADDMVLPSRSDETPTCPGAEVLQGHKLFVVATPDNGAIIDAVTDTNPPVRMRFTLSWGELSDLSAQMVDAMNGEGA